MNIENLTKEQLEVLKLKIELKLSGTSFSETIEKVLDLKNKIQEIEKEIRLTFITSREIIEIKNLGFNTVVYSTNEIAFINYVIPKLENEWYQITFNYLTKELTNNPINPATEDEVKKIKEILKIN
jgi:hypothetical protein